MKKSSLLSVLLVGLTSLSLVSCGDSSKTIVVSGSGEDQEFVTTYAQKYLADNNLSGEYTIKYVQHGEDKVDTEVTDWKGNDSPDLYSFACDKTVGLVAAGALAAVPEADVTDMNKNLTKAAVESATLAGTVYAYPWTTSNGYFMYYDSSIVSETEAATLDLDGWIKKAKDNNLKLAFPFKTAWYAIGTMTSFGASWSVTYDQSGKATASSSNFNSDAGKKAAKIMDKVIHSGVYQDSQAAPGSTNEVLACLNGSWAISGDDATQWSASNVKATKLPNVTIDSETQHIRSFIGTKLYGVNPQKSSGNETRLNVIRGMAKYFLSDTVQEARFDANQSAPSSKAVGALEKVTSNMYVAALADQGADGVVQANLPAKIWDTTTTLVQAMIDSTTELTDEALTTQLKAMDDLCAQLS